MDNHTDRHRALLLKIPEAAQALGIGRSTLYELIAQGDVETVHIGRSCRVPVAALDAYIDRLRRAAAGSAR